MTDDIQSVVALLEEEGCTIKECNTIEAEPTTQADMLLPGESAADVFPGVAVALPDPESQENV